ncbi:MAG TPA: hypothetical protein VGD37_30475 [Kofleriaceae bacterium]
MNGLVVCLVAVLVACGGVSNPATDARQADAPAADAAGANCVTDGFDGSVLKSSWSVLVGAVPTTYDVSGSRLFISDAPFAPTPSMPGTSWIYDLDTDKANQIAWPQAIGGEDFTLTADLGWSSTLAEFTLGGVGLSDAQGTIEALAGVTDGSVNTNGVAYGRLHVATGSDLFMLGPNQEPGTATVKIQRVNGMATISIDAMPVVTGAMPGLISNIVIFYVRFRSAMTLYDFGSLEVREIKLCRP